MWNIISKKLTFVSFYYFSVVFLAACIYYDTYGGGTVSGFTYGYVVALGYYILRARKRIREEKGGGD
jgi:hypothetical protein